MLVFSAVTQIYSAAKIIAKNEYTIKELQKFRNDYDRHIEDYNELTKSVSFLIGTCRGRHGV